MCNRPQLMRHEKGIFLFALIASTLALKSSQVAVYPSVSNNAFQAGEKLRYRITYGFVDAGEAVLEVKTTTKTGSETGNYCTSKEPEKPWADSTRCSKCTIFTKVISTKRVSFRGYSSAA